MGKPTGFMEYPRKKVPWRDANDRLKDYGEVYTPATESHLQRQGARCMDCGVPFCMSDSGCPIDNLIPEWNDLVYNCLLYTSPSPRDAHESRMPSSA